MAPSGLFLALLLLCGGVAAMGVVAARDPRADGAPHNVALIDYVKGATPPRVLLRGGFEQPAFNWTAFVGELARVATNTTGEAFAPNSTFVIDINLTSADQSETSRDPARAHREFVYFDAHPQHGEFHLFKTVGASANATDEALFSGAVGRRYRAFLARTLSDWAADQLPLRTAALHSLLRHSDAAGKDKALIVFVHCDCGCDRTGTVAGAYALRYGAFSWARVNEWNRQLSYGHGQKCPEYRSMQWFCLWLAADDADAAADCLVQHPCIARSGHGNADADVDDNAYASL